MEWQIILAIVLLSTSSSIFLVYVCNLCKKKKKSITTPFTTAETLQHIYARKQLINQVSVPFVHRQEHISSENFPSVPVHFPSVPMTDSVPMSRFPSVPNDTNACYTETVISHCTV